MEAARMPATTAIMNRDRRPLDTRCILMDSAVRYGSAMPFAELRGQRIHYEDSGGAGMPVVLGHGFLMDGDMFLPQVRALAPRYRVITWDARGHGRTEA